MDFPIDVFVDTEVYENQCFDFSKKGRLELLKKYVKKGVIKLLTSDIVVHEAKKHIKSNVEKIVEDINKKYKGRELAIFRDGKFKDSFDELNSQDLVEYALSQFDAYLSDTDAFVLDLNTVEITSVMDDYFSGRKPFGSGKKKNEFPDAFNISMLKKYKNENNQIYVLSGDNDFQDIEGVYVFKTIDELLNSINIEELIAQQALNYIVEECKTKIEKDIEEKFIENVDSIETDGYEYDFKGNQGVWEYEDVNLLNITPVSCSKPEIIDYDPDSQTIISTMQYIVEFKLNCEFFDFENSEWNYEDNEFLYEEYGNIIEVHIKEIYVKLNLKYEYENGDLGNLPKFVVDSIEIDTDQKFTHKTLIVKWKVI